MAVVVNTVNASEHTEATIIKCSSSLNSKKRFNVNTDIIICIQMVWNEKVEYKRVHIKSSSPKNPNFM